MADEWDKYATDDFEQYASNEEKSQSPNILGTAGVAVGAGAVGYGAYQGGKRFFEPYGIKNDMTKKLLEIQRSEGLSSGTELSFIPKQFNAKKSELLENFSQQKKLLDTSFRNINNKVIPQSSYSLADEIVANIPDFNRNLSSGYVNKINAISDTADKLGFKFTTNHFDSDVIDKAMDTALKQGVPPESLKRFEILKNTLKERSMVVDASGKSFGSPMSVKEANSAVSKIINESPYSPESAILRQSWSDFMEGNAPESIRLQIKNLNAKFKPAVELRTKLSKFVDPKTGVYDTKRLGSYISDYAKGQRGGDVESAMELLTKGNEIVRPMPNIGGKFDSIKMLRDQRSNILSEVNNMVNATEGKKAAIATKTRTANELLSKLKQADSRIANRNVVAKLFQSVTGIGVKGLRAMGPLGMIAQAGQLSSNPEDALRSMSFLPTKAEEKDNFNKFLQQLDVKVGEGKMTREQAAEKRFMAEGGI